MLYANKAVQALLKGDLVNVIVNENNTTVKTMHLKLISKMY